MASRSRAPVRRTQDLGAGPGTQSRVSGWPVEPGAPGDSARGRGMALLDRRVLGRWWKPVDGQAQEGLVRSMAALGGTLARRLALGPVQAGQGAQLRPAPEQTAPRGQAGNKASPFLQQWTNMQAWGKGWVWLCVPEGSRPRLTGNSSCRILDMGSEAKTRSHLRGP